MSEPFVGEIRMFAGNFAPRGWAYCDGQLVAIAQNEALFSLLGTYYGGDGRTTFGLPDLRGRLPMHQNPGTGFRLGQKGGTETVTLTVNQLPTHTHTLRYSQSRADTSNPADSVLARSALGDRQYYAAENAKIADMHSGAVEPMIGGSRAHNNMPPFLCLRFIIAFSGIYPSRN